MSNMGSDSYFPDNKADILTKWNTKIKRLKVTEAALNIWIRMHYLKKKNNCKW